MKLFSRQFGDSVYLRIFLFKKKLVWHESLSNNESGLKVKGSIMEVFRFLIFGCWSDLTENERFFRELLKIRNDQHWYTQLFCSHKVFPKLTICLLKHKIESENQTFGSRLLNRNMKTSIIKPLSIECKAIMSQKYRSANPECTGLLSNILSEPVHLGSAPL